MKNINEFKASNKIKGFVGKLFEARQVAHAVHLQTTSYAQHMALNQFYDALLLLVDSFVETWQGQYGLVSGYDVGATKMPESIEKYLSDFAEEIKSVRKSMAEDDSHLQNILDEMTSLVYSTVYKLKYLK